MVHCQTSPERDHLLVPIQKNILFVTLGVKSQDGLNGNIDTLESIFFKHALDHFFPVGLGVHGRFRQHDFGILGIDLKFLIEGVIPEVTHIRPVFNNAILHRVGHLQDRSQLGSLITDHDILHLNIAN